jgi:hypothetical protein
MKKVSIMCLLFLLAAGGVLFAQDYDQFYDMVVPYTHDYLSVGGSLGSSNNALEIELDTTTSPASFSFDLGGMVDYEYEIVQEHESIIIDAGADVEIGTTQVYLNPIITGEYTSYSLELGGYPGFYSAGGDLEFDIDSSFSPTRTIMDLSAFGEIGVGRLHGSIRIIRQVLLIMDTLGIEPTEERVRSAAEIIATRSVRLQAYSENFTGNYRDYYNDLAAALGYSGDILNLVHIVNSQEYGFEIGRSSFMNYGWEASVRLAPDFYYNSLNSAGNKASFGFDLILSAKYADFVMDGMLYYYGSASMTPGYSTAFTFATNIRGEAAYLPENPRWYARGWANIAFNKDSAPNLGLTLGATANYLLSPNFVTYAGLSVTTNFASITVSAGGTYRIW